MTQPRAERRAQRVHKFLLGALTRSPDADDAQASRRHRAGEPRDTRIGQDVVARGHGVTAEAREIAAVTGQVSDQPVGDAQLLTEFAGVSGRAQDAAAPQFAEPRQRVADRDAAVERGRGKHRDQFQAGGTPAQLVEHEGVDALVAAIKFGRGA